jgi:hypothetical protein
MPLKRTKTPRYRTIHRCQYHIMAHKTNTTYQQNPQDTQRPPNRDQSHKRGELSQPPTNQQPHHNTNKHSPRQPISWQPLHNSNEWIYTDGSLKKGQPRIGAAVIHSPITTTAYIDASGQGETRTIMRAELAAIQVALNTCKMTHGLASSQTHKLASTPSRINSNDPHTQPTTTTNLL